ncbi:MAG TPA: four helix bundle protein [Ignavibacteriaceae bacterium]|nr:four helix bundle protein [Ignavibacteriaceae bacterium]
MKFNSFEDLQVWKDSRVFVHSIYQLTSEGKFNKDFGLRDQIQRAAVSIMNNIAEGFERNNNKEFVKFLGYSKGSAGEIRSMLYVALDLDYISRNDFDKIYSAAINIVTQLSNFIKYLRKNFIKEKINTVKLLFYSLIKI